MSSIGHQIVRYKFYWSFKSDSGNLNCIGNAITTVTVSAGSLPCSRMAIINGTLPGTGILNLWISCNDRATADKQCSTKCDTSNVSLVVHGPTANNAYYV